MVFVLFSALFAIACCCDWRFFCAQQAGTPVTDSNCSSQVSLFQSPWFAECAQPARSCEGDGQCLEANVCTSLGGEISSSVSSCPQSVQGSSGMGTPNVACCVGAKTFQPDAWIVSTSVGNVKAKWSVCSSVSPKGEIIGAFRGIPFAAPPVGALRFAAPIQPARLGGLWMKRKKKRRNTFFSPRHD
jgi:hypothetical protein